MKFLIDENLPPALAEFFHQSGFESLHVNAFGNELPISDNALRKFALHKHWIIVTRDDDFVKSYVSRKVPERLIYVFGLEKKKDILDAFAAHWEEFCQYLEDFELIEINPSGIKKHW